MNKKNFPIFISLLIVSLFFTVIFYYSYTNIMANYEYIMSTAFGHAELEGDLSIEDIQKIKTIKGVNLVGKMSLMPDNALYNGDLLVLNYQDEDVNEMREFSKLIDGRFAKSENEIVLSKTFIEKK